MDEDYESEWGDIDDRDLIAAVDEAERRASKHSRVQSGGNGIHYRKDNPGGNGSLNQAMSEAVSFTPLEREARVSVSSASTLADGAPVAERDRNKIVGRHDAQRDEGGASKRSRRLHHVKGSKYGL